MQGPRELFPGELFSFVLKQTTEGLSSIRVEGYEQQDFFRLALYPHYSGSLWIPTGGRWVESRQILFFTRIFPVDSAATCIGLHSE